MRLNSRWFFDTHSMYIVVYNMNNFDHKNKVIWMIVKRFEEDFHNYVLSNLSKITPSISFSITHFVKTFNYYYYYFLWNKWIEQKLNNIDFSLVQLYHSIFIQDHKNVYFLRNNKKDFLLKFKFSHFFLK